MKSEKCLLLRGRLKQEPDGPFWFRTVTGTAPDGRKTLVIWRKLTGKPEEDTWCWTSGSPGRATLTRTASSI